MTNARRVLATLGAATLAALIVVAISGAATASADESTATAATTLTLQQPREGSGTDAVSIPARLTDAEGNPLGNAPVDFSVSTDFFGERPAELGTVVTDATGTATLVYEPTWEGTHEITASYGGDATHAASETTSTVDVSGPFPRYAPESMRLEALQRWAPAGAILLATTVWALLAFVAVRTMSGIARAGARATAEEASWAVGAGTEPASSP